MLQFDGVSKSFGNIPAVRNVSLAIQAGELIAILGPSGCGKSTLLRIAGGYESADTGSVRIGAVDVTRLAAERRNIGMVFQNYALFPHMCVRDNVEFGLRMRRVAPHERRDRARAMLSLVGLDGLGQRKPSELSGGQQQRVALARALVIEPAVLLLDEPLANLDRNERVRMRDELRALQRRLAITAALVTHDQEEALTIADRIAVMNAGRIEQMGRPLDLCLNPKTTFVSAFLGMQ
jgi:ABC-type Fe3+/spermidine/putrescine transport system ATPase subunit